jgi:transaldolase
VKLFLDTANLDEIREVHAWGVLAGVTTNPSLIAKEGKDFVETVHQICEIVQGPVSAEVVAQDTEGMVREGRLLAQVHEHVIVKVPLTEAGLGACRRLSDEGIRVNVTLCFQPAQALLAGLAGAAYISPFLGRVDDVSWDGIELVRQIVEIYTQSAEIDTQVLAASLRHPLHVVQAAMAGADVGTAPYSVLKAAVKHPLTDIGNARFLKDWEKVPDRDISAQVERWLAKRPAAKPAAKASRTA